MQRTLLRVLCCPECGSDVALTSFDSGGSEIATVEAGVLRCTRCERLFPVINGIPRMLPDPLMPLVPSYHPEFFRRPDVAALWSTRPAAPAGDAAWWKAERRTIRSYSYQWRKFKQMFPHWEQVFLDSTRPLTPDFFPGKLGLDAGCGFGRSLYYAAGYGAEMIGLDLSEAIEAARENTRHLANVHLVQADIFHPPIRPGSLDFAYSIGVLHHLPDPKRGFLSLTPLIRDGGAMSIWVYLRGRGRQIAWFNRVRALSTRMPLWMVNLWALLLAAAQWVLWILPHRILTALGLSRLADRIPFSLYAKYPFRVLHTDWVDGLAVPLQRYYRADEIRTWFEEGGYDRIVIEPDWNGRALGYRPR